MELIQWWFDKWINSRCHRWVPMSGFEWLFLLRDSFQWAFLLLNCGLAMIFIEWVDSLLFSTSSSCGKVAKSGLFHSKNDPPCDALSSWCLLNYLIESLAMIMSTLPAAYLLDFIHLLIIFFSSCSQSSTNIWRGKCCDCSAFEDRHFRQFQTLISSVDSYLFLVFSWLGECWEFFVQSSCKKTPKMAVAIRQNLAWSTKNVSRWLMCFTSWTAIDIDSELLKNR